MGVNRDNLVEAGLPVRHHPIGVIMGGGSQRCGTRRHQEMSPASCRALGPGRIGEPVPRHRIVAGKAELAPGGPLRPLKHNAADRVGKGGVAGAVDNDLCDGALTQRVVAGFIKHCDSKAVEGAGALFRAPCKDKGPGAWVRRIYKGDGGVIGARLIHRHVLKRHGFDLRNLCFRHDPDRGHLVVAMRGERWRLEHNDRRNNKGRNRRQGEQRPQSEAWWSLFFLRGLVSPSARYAGVTAGQSWLLGDRTALPNRIRCKSEPVTQGSCIGLCHGQCSTTCHWQGRVSFQAGNPAPTGNARRCRS